MPRISDPQVEQIKSKLSLLDQAQHQGHAPKPQGSEYVLNCPFHEDNTPSCYINPEKNVFYCHGCNAKGDVIEWTMKTRNLEFRQACELLAKQAGIEIEQTPSAATQPKMLTTDKLFQQVVEHYHQSLKQSLEAQAYLKKRGLDCPDLINHFKLGYADRSLLKCIPGSRRTSQPMRAQLKEIGIIREKGMEHMHGSLVVPILDEHNHPYQLYGRKINESSSKNAGPKHLYLSKPHEHLWNLDGLKTSDTLILCESLIDAMTFWVNGFRNVTTSYGTNGFTEHHLSAIQQHKIKSLYIAYDRDSAGDGAALAVTQQLTEAKVACYRVQFPQGLDANEYALQYAPAKEPFQQLINQAQPMNEPAAKAAEETIIADPETGEILNCDSTPSSSSAAKAAKPSSKDSWKLEGDDYHTQYQDRHYRIRNFNANRSGHLKINLRIRRNDPIHIDSLDLYQAKSRFHFIHQAAKELSIDEDLIKKDLTKILVKLESLQIEKSKETAPKAIELSPQAIEAALELLKDPNLMQRILEDFDATGLVGEETNKLVGYLAAVSRKCEKPLAIMIQSSSAAGKSSLMDLILKLIPEEERIQYTAMTGQSLFYMGETNLKHKILAIAEEEGAEQASYALKLLQSEGEISIASTGKDPKTGQLITQTYRVEGPVMLFMTTTAIDVDPELMNRCITLSVNESRHQTQAIHGKQREEESLEGLFNRSGREAIIEQHQNAQRLLKPVNIVNPYAHQLTFISDQTRTRRDHKKYLGLIRSITLLHQYQRPVKSETRHGVTQTYIEVTLDDIYWANKLTHEVLGSSLDELPPQTRKLLELIYEWVQHQLKVHNLAQKDLRFTRKQIRSFSNWGHTQLKVHLQRLEEMEYLIIHSGGRGRTLEYELIYRGEGQKNSRFTLGLMDIEHLNGNRSGQNSHLSAPSRGQVGPKSERCRGEENSFKPTKIEENEKNVKNPQTSTTGVKKEQHPSVQSLAVVEV